VWFWEEAARPESVRGPVLCWELARLAAIWAGEIGGLGGVGLADSLTLAVLLGVLVTEAGLLGVGGGEWWGNRLCGLV
jgi:hypothetical protein